MLKIAVAQIECAPGDIAANLAAHLRMIEAARAQRVELLLFPELSLTDYLAAPDCAALALTSDAAPLREIAQAADGVAVSFGFIERDDGFFRNTQALVQNGRLLGLHRKLNIPSYGNLSEGRHYRGGETLPPSVAVHDARIATLICADLWNPALPWLTALGGADVLLAPVASALDAVGGDFDNPSGWDVTLRHTSLLYGLPIAFANHCGARGGLRFWGGSRILDPFGRAIAQAGEDEALIHADINLAEIAQARRRLPTIRDADPALIARELWRRMDRRQA